jgi:sec-independent protein translocase protein TatA
MGSMSIWHWLVVAVIVLLLFGRGKIPELMGDVAKGIKSFKAGMKDDEVAKADDVKKELEGKAGDPVAKTEQKIG